MIDMDYEKKYNEALERAQKATRAGSDVAMDIVQYIFPELAESEDERIINAIIGILKNSNAIDINVSQEQMIAYLEKQKETHYTKRNALFDKCVAECDPAVMKEVSDEIDEMLEKEQKPAEWSEKDEAIRNNIIRVLSAFVGTVECDSNSSLSSSYPTYLREIDWLKSLRPSWKPSEEQMEAFRSYVGDFQERAEAAVGGWNNFDVMIRLFEQLKKLM